MFQQKNGSGSICTKELLGVMRSIGKNPTEDEILEIVMESDLNGDGKIDFDEFSQMMKKKISESDHTEVIVFNSTISTYNDSRERVILL